MIVVKSRSWKLLCWGLQDEIGRHDVGSKTTIRIWIFYWSISNFVYNFPTQTKLFQGWTSKHKTTRIFDFSRTTEFKLDFLIKLTVQRILFTTWCHMHRHALLIHLRAKLFGHNSALIRDRMLNRIFDPFMTRSRYTTSGFLSKTKMRHVWADWISGSKVHVHAPACK